MHKNGEKPTLKTISELSGLAVATVSRALSDAPDLSLETKKRVRKIAEEIGYVPNRAGLRLRTGRTNVIALVTPAEHNPLNHASKLQSAVAEGLKGTQYHLNVSPWFPDEDQMRPIRYIVETRSADAIIFNTTQPDDPRIKYLLESNFPFATHGRSNFADQHAYFDYDNAAFSRIAFQKLAMRGRKTIALILPPRSQNYALDMLEGAKNAAAETDLKFIICEAITSDDPVEDIQKNLETHLRDHPEIDAIVTGSTIASLAAAHAVENINRVIGEDIDIFSREAFPFLKLFRSQILAVPEDVERAGHELARAVLQAIKEPGTPPIHALETPILEDIR